MTVPCGPMCSCLKLTLLNLSPFLHRILLAVRVYFLTECMFIPSPPFALEGHSASLVDGWNPFYYLMPGAPFAAYEFCNQGTSCNKAKPGAFSNQCFVLLVPMSYFLFTRQSMLDKVLGLKCAFRANHKGSQLYKALSCVLKNILETLFKETELFTDCSLIMMNIYIYFGLIWP